MDRFIIILIGLLVVSVLYSYIVRKFTTNKLVLYLPSYIGVVFIVYIFTFYSPGVGFEDLARIVTSMLVVPIIIGNTVSGIIMDRKNKG